MRTWLLESNWRTRVLSLSLWACALLGTHRSHAQLAPSAELRSAASQALFDEGRRLEPASGTLLNLALCHEASGKIATAWVSYTDALALAVREGNTDRQAIARSRIELLTPSLSRLVFHPPKGMPPDYWVSLDDVRLGTAALDMGVPVDPGEHVVNAGAPGKRPASLLLKVETTAQMLEVALPELEPEAPAPAAARPVPKAATSTRTNDTNWLLRGPAIGLAASGVLAGTYFGLQAMSDWDRRNELCRNGCDDRAVE